VGRGDRISLSVYDAPELTVTIRIGPDGHIRLPMPGITGSYYKSTKG
jgi:protein involved in polysaccharide export with SLBB domain